MHEWRTLGDHMVRDQSVVFSALSAGASTIIIDKCPTTASWMFSGWRTVYKGSDGNGTRMQAHSAEGRGCLKITSPGPTLTRLWR